MSKKANPEAMKWPTDKAKYDKNYEKIFCMICKHCKGKGCPACNWSGGFDKCKIGDEQR